MIISKLTLPEDGAFELGGNVLDGGFLNLHAPTEGLPEGKRAPRNDQRGSSREVPAWARDRFQGRCGQRRMLGFKVNE